VIIALNEISYLLGLDMVRAALFTGFLFASAAWVASVLKS